MRWRINISFVLAAFLAVGFALASVDLAHARNQLPQPSSSQKPKDVKPPANLTLKQAKALLATLALRPLAPGKSSPMPAGGQRMPRAGEDNSYKLPVNADLAMAYDAFLAGDGEAALAALGRVGAGGNAKMAWHLSSMKAQTLIMMGRAADVDAELEIAAKLEQKAWGRTVFTRSQKGEALVWVGDYDGAVKVLAPVADELKDWRLKTSYFLPPGNVDELVYMTTAQLRAYTALAGQYLLQGKIAEALSWAQRAETLYADVHYVAAHNLYGRYVKVHLDSFYGRALNLTFKGAAEIVAAKSLEAGQADLEAAARFYQALGYEPGAVTIAALKAWALLEIGDLDAANLAAVEAVEAAKAANLADLIWRVQALRGEALLADGRKTEAEAAFREAQAAVAAVSGGLTSDRAKRRFGVGKGDIIYRLAGFSLERKDWKTLFRDVEEGRARAFVDMLAGVPVGDGSEADQIRKLDEEIRLARLKSGDQDGVKDLLTRRAALLRQLADRRPDLADAYGVRVSNLKTIQQALPGRATLIYSLPMRFEDPLRLLSITKSKVGLVQQTGDMVDLVKALGALDKAVKSGDVAGQSKAVLALQDALGVKGWNGDSLYVVPGSYLHFVPWSAVVAGRPVTVIPNAGWLTRKAVAQGGAAKVAVLGDPDFAGRLPALPGARAEAKAIADLYNAQSLSGDAATLQDLRGQTAGGVDILHLATHGTFDSRYPLNSALYFAGGEALTAAEIYQKPIKADLVVLSACETGLGEVAADDDFLGLARSFYLGGAKAVVNSLWQVEDEGTKVFMEAFHKNIAALGYARAFAKARDVTKGQGYPVSVYGAFVLGGAVQ